VVRCPAADREPGPTPSRMLSRCSRTSERDHLARIRLDVAAVRGPGGHQLLPLLEQVAAPVGRLHLVAHCMGKRHFYNFTREVGALGCPIAEGRTEAMHGNVAAAMRRSTSVIAMLERGSPAFPPENT
jgi:hypothetical protein